MRAHNDVDRVRRWELIAASVLRAPGEIHES
jgi:hypothetical protein